MTKSKRQLLAQKIGGRRAGAARAQRRRCAERYVNVNMRNFMDRGARAFLAGINR